MKDPVAEQKFHGRVCVLLEVTPQQARLVLASFRSFVSVQTRESSVILEQAMM